MVLCGAAGNPPTPTYSVYNLESGQWTTFTVSSRCPGSCEAIAVGRYWVKLVSQGLAEHSPQEYYLQNIQGGQFIRDPVRPGGRNFDDLDVASGSAALCPPLRYPWSPDVSVGVGWQPGLITMYGQFALTFGGRSPHADPGRAHLFRCQSKLDLAVPIAWPPSTSLPASSRAVVLTTNGKTISGWLLPSLRRLIVYPPARTQARACKCGERNGVIPLAVTTRHIYVRALCGTQTVWMASLPRP